MTRKYNFTKVKLPFERGRVSKRFLKSKRLVLQEKTRVGKEISSIE